MDTTDFINGYLQPAQGDVNPAFRLPLPEISGLTQTSEFIVQSHAEDTWSTNYILRHDSSEANIRLVEVYKNTQNQVTGSFVRLVGTMALVRHGLPCLFLDAAVSNIDMQSGQQQAPETRVAIHVPQASDAGRGALLADLNAQAVRAGIACRQVEIPVLPPFWGPLWCAQEPGVALQWIASLRHVAWQAYQSLSAACTPQPDFDYRPVQIQMVLENSRAEHGQFNRMGLHVPIAVQAAFFSVLVSDV